MAEIIKKQRKISVKLRNSSATKGWKWLLSNYQAENSCDPKQLEAELKSGVVYKNNVFRVSSLRWVQILKKDSLA